jgi:2-polyprenyl-6-methoxyphenol hydroxylase-like FAD-dependent oxidoreductase
VTGSRVVIVGAGPAGTALALQLSRAGVPTTLVEASRHFERHFRGEALMPSGLEAIAAMGMAGLLAAVPQRPLRGWQVVVNGQPLFAVPEPPAREAGPGCTLVSQPALLEALVANCRQQRQFRWVQGQSANGLVEREGRICGVVLGSGEQLAADLVVACDGRSSLMRLRAGLELVEEPQPIDVLWMRLEARTPAPLAGQFTTVLGPQGLFSAFERVQGGVQVGWVLATGEETPPGDGATWIERLASQSPSGLAHWLRREEPSLEPPVRLGVRAGLARRWWRPGLLLLGDAAHPMSPVRAQGLNMALRDAWAAGATLTPLLQSGAPAALLDAALPALVERRQAEVAALQALQRQEIQRGMLLLRQGWLRGLAAAAAPWLGAAIGHHWQQQQRPLRHGLTPSGAMMAP